MIYPMKSVGILLVEMFGFQGGWVSGNPNIVLFVFKKYVDLCNCGSSLIMLI